MNSSSPGPCRGGRRFDKLTVPSEVEGPCAATPPLRPETSCWLHDAGIIRDAIPFETPVIPANSGIHFPGLWKCVVDGLDSRLRGNDCGLERPCLENDTNARFITSLSFGSASVYNGCHMREPSMLRLAQELEWLGCELEFYGHRHALAGFPKAGPIKDDFLKKKRGVKVTVDKIERELKASVRFNP